MEAQITYRRRIVYLLAGVVSMLFAGIIYAWSILKMPLEETFGWTLTQTALNFTITMCFFCVGGMASGQLLKQGKSPKIVMFIAGCLVALGFFLTSTLTGNIILLYVYYGALGGFGIGMAYNAIIAATGAWFPDRKGTCFGALMMGFGASALVLGNLVGMMIESVDIGWRQTYLALGISMGLVLILHGLIIRFPPQGMEFPKPPQKKGGSGAEFTPKDFTTSEMIKRKSFKCFFLYLISLAAVGTTVISFATNLSISVGATGALATTLVGVLSICNGLGRILCGTIFDMVGRRKTMFLANGVTIVAILVCMLAIVMESLPIIIIGLCLTGLSFGCGPTISSAFVAAFYGPKHFPMNFSVSNTMLIPASFVATFSAGLASMTGTFLSSFLMLLVIALIGLAMNLSIKQP